jgi:prolyl-tRNA synthetase
MRMTSLFSQTLRDAPSEAEIPSHRLLLRAGFIRQLAAGIFTLMPLGRRAQTRIESIIRQEMDAIGGQEMTMPVVHPAELWKETGRWYSIDAEMGRFKDRTGRDMVLAMTHEEVVADLVRNEIRSYRQLPAMIYHIQTKWRDDPRPRAGLIRVREFTMKDSYSLDADFDGLERQYRAHYQAYFNIFHRCGIDAVTVGADTGMMGGKVSHEYMYLSPYGEDTLLLCDSCGYAANRQVARFRKPAAQAEAALPSEPVATPDARTIAELAALLNIPASRTAKAVFLVAEVRSGQTDPQTGAPLYEPRFVFAVIRGDLDVNETKLANAVKARSLRPATEDEIRAVGAVPGYASPLGLEKPAGGLPVITVVDDLIPDSPNLVAGANRAGYHLLNVNYGRDYSADIVADIAAAAEGDPCPQCGSALRAARGVEVGNIFQLGTRYSDSLGCTYLDAAGQIRPVVMGSYGIGVGRLLACVAEACHDDNGLIWPVSVAPYPVHLTLLAGKPGKDNADTPAVADRLYAALQAAGIDVLYDDRDESPGVKFNDADLLGMPLRLTVSSRALQSGGVEFKRRDRAEKRIVPLDQAVAEIRAELADMQAAIDATVQMVAYV